MDDRPSVKLLLDPFHCMTAQQRITEICRILAAGLLRARAKGTLPVVTPEPLQRRAKPKNGKRHRGWAGSRVI
jgi:hypothetical protein